MSVVGFEPTMDEIMDFEEDNDISNKKLIRKAMTILNISEDYSTVDAIKWVKSGIFPKEALELLK